MTAAFSDSDTAVGAGFITWLALILVVFGVWVANLVHAYRSAVAWNRAHGVAS